MTFLYAYYYFSSFFLSISPTFSLLLIFPSHYLYAKCVYFLVYILFFILMNLDTFCTILAPHFLKSLEDSTSTGKICQGTVTLHYYYYHANLVATPSNFFFSLDFTMFSSPLNIPFQVTQLWLSFVLMWFQDCFENG